MAARRGAFLMLYHEDEERAVRFLASRLDDVASFGDGFALLVLDLVRQSCRRDPRQKSRFVRVLFQLLGSENPAVSYEAAWTLISLSNAPNIVLEILIINRTPNTLANLTVEPSAMGDMKIVERLQSQTLGPLDQTTIRASIKVSSTETGHIFGTIVYEDATTQEMGYVNLNDIHIDIMDYIRPATCTEEAFRSMWAEFEWENKVAISTSITELIEFLDHIVESTKMTCLTPHDREGKGSFLAANLYAKR